MSFNLENYCRRSFESEDARLLEKRREIEKVEIALEAQKEEFQMRMKILPQRRTELESKEEQLKESLLKFDKFLKENDSKRGRAMKKACEEREVVQQKQMEIEWLKQERSALQSRKEKLLKKVQKNAIYWEFLEKVTKGTKKFEEIWELLARFDTLLATREHLLQKSSEGQGCWETQRLQLRRFVEEQGNRILQCNNQLSALQTELDQTRSEAFKWETTWNHIQSTAAKETLLLGQIKVVTLNLFNMTGGKTEEDKGVRIEDTVQQLDRIQLFIRHQAGIISELQLTYPAANTNIK